MNFHVTKKLTIGLIATALFLAAGIPAAKAEDEVPSADTSIGLYSKYIWRGYELSEDSLAIQPSLIVSSKGFSANLWASFDTDFYGIESHKWVETDYTLSYDGSYGILGYGVGWIYYAINADGDSDTQEFYGTLSLDVLLSPSLTFYYDTDNFQGDWYALLAIGHSFELAEAISLDLGLSAGYYSINDYYGSGSDYTAFHDGILSVAMPFGIGEYITITPELYWSFPLSSESEDFYVAANIDGDGDDDYVYGGVSASFSF
jgi:uncharacterized protein (TIGR02001 family)